MKIDILTLFPDMFKPFLEESIIGRAINKGLVEVNLINIRDFSTLNNNQVDDNNQIGVYNSENSNGSNEHEETDFDDEEIKVITMTYLDIFEHKLCPEEFKS